MGVFGGGFSLSCDFRNRIQQGRRGAKARDTLKPPCVFNLSPLARSTLCSQKLQKIILLCFSPACWKWPNYCQEEECEAFPGALRDVTAPRRPLRFRQLGYSRAHSTPNSQQLESTAASLQLQNNPKKKKKKHTPPPPTSSYPLCPVSEGMILTSGSFLLTIVNC